MLGEITNAAAKPTINSLEDLSEAVTAVANRAIKYGAEHTSSGNRIFCADDFYDLISPEDFAKYFDLIAYEVSSREELLDLETDSVKHELDCNFGLDYCPNYQFCEGDEEIFGSFEEWEKMEAKPVSQPLSMRRMAQIGEEVVRAMQEWFNDPMKKLTGFFGVDKDELDRLGVLADKQDENLRNKTP